MTQNQKKFVFITFGSRNSEMQCIVNKISFLYFIPFSIVPFWSPIVQYVQKVFTFQYDVTGTSAALTHEMEESYCSIHPISHTKSEEFWSDHYAICFYGAC